MSVHNLSEFEKARARKLAQELRDKMAEYFPRETTDEEMAQVRKLREELEAMGFRVEWSVGFNLSTLSSTAEVRLWIPKEASEQTDQPQN